MASGNGVRIIGHILEYTYTGTSTKCLKVTYAQVLAVCRQELRGKCVYFYTYPKLFVSSTYLHAVHAENMPTLNYPSSNSYFVPEVSVI